MLDSNVMMIQAQMRAAGGQQRKAARTRYHSAQLRAQAGQIWARLTGRPARLLSLDDVRQSHAVGNARYAGLRAVPLAHIRGSEGRGDDFDGGFRPLSSHTMGRWLSIAAARGEGLTLPAVSLIQVGQDYYVRDGHHRVSVARAFGQEMIDAEVTVWTVGD